MALGLLIYEPAMSRFVFSPLKPKYSLKKSGNKYRKAKFYLFFFFFFERLVDICCYPNGKKKVNFVLRWLAMSHVNLSGHMKNKKGESKVICFPSFSLTQI